MNISQQQPQARIAVVDMVLPIGSIAPIVGYEGMQNIVTVADMLPAETTADLSPYNYRKCIFLQPVAGGLLDPETSNYLKVGAHLGYCQSVLKESHDYVLIHIGRSLSNNHFTAH